MKKFFLDIEIGEGATNYEEIAKQEHLSALEIFVRRLNDRVKDIRAEQNYLRVNKNHNYNHQLFLSHSSKIIS